MTKPRKKKRRKVGRRRKRREGTIFKRRDGRYSASLSLGYRNGKRWRKTFYGKTAEEVVEKLTKARNDQRQGLPVAVERQTVGGFLSRWLEDTARPRLREGTYADYRQVVEKHLTPALGRHQLQKLAPEHVQSLLAEEARSGISPGRIRVIRAVLHTALRQAVEWGLVPRNVADLVRAPRSRRYQAVTLTAKQAKSFLKVAGKHPVGPLFSVALAVGLRLGEALGLGWEDVDLQGGSLTVRRTLQRVGGKLQFGEPKSDKSRRTVTLPEVTVKTLKKHRTRQRKERLVAGGRWVDSGLVFTTSIGTALDERNVRRAFKALLVEAKLPPMRIHDLRHTCATLLLEQGVHPKIVQETLGHSQIGLTLDTYSHVLPHVSREAAEQMNALLSA